MNIHQPQKGLHGFFTSENESIYFESHGQGETIILCHGLGGNHAIWYQQVPVLAQQYQVITWDQRGFGRSSNHAEQAGPPAAVKDLGALLDHLSIKRAHLIGQSMGGWAVLGFALNRPSCLHSLVLADTIGGIYTPGIAAAYDAFNKTGRSPDELPFGEHPAVGRQLTQQNLAQAFLYSQIGSVAQPPPANIIPLLRNTAYPLEAVNQLDIPTLLIVGSNDPIFAPATIHEAATQLPNARVIEIPGTGHSPYFETPQLWNEAVLNFLNRE